jgi:hypothetical protein
MLLNKDLIKLLLDQPMDSVIYIGKGMGPAENVEFAGDKGDELTVVVISPGPRR